MHIHHPEIAAKWSAEGHGYVEGKKKRVRKSAKDAGWLKPLLVGTAAGALANQAPPVQKIVRDERKKHGKVKKAYTPTSSDPEFNHQAAEAAFNLVMKMDDETAEMFTHIVVSDLMEADITNNLETIQKALNQVFDQRAEMLKKALTKAALNSPPDRLEEFGKAYGLVEELSKAERNQYYYGAPWEESQYRRDPGGRFAVKVSHTMTQPIKDKDQATALIGSWGKEGLTTKQRAQYQDEYRQVASFLSNVAAMGTGNHDVVYHLRDRAGHQFTEVHNTGLPDDMLNNPDTQLIAMEAKPTTLTAGGAAFGLMPSMNAEQIKRTDRVFTGRDASGTALASPITDFSGGWETAGNAKESNSRLFNRLESSGAFLGAAAPPGSKAQLAGKFAQVVGQYGPEAEKVIGPTARKTGYRYRGTEKAPDQELVSVYGRQIEEAKKYGITEKEADARLAGFGTTREQARGDFTSFQTRRMTGGRGEPLPYEAPAPEPNQISRYRAYEEGMANRKPTWAEQGAGSAIVADYLRRKVPSKELYKLHMEAGNTPPSEGIIINADGQLAVQAVGYGDDHYLPFNLKNLSSLKGGEYIRNRSVGGLTGEDIYTGLMTGARRVTVVSRSGTFSMEFAPDFRGGRRHNDKARRMTQRYEQLLDAVQSGQVDRAQVPKAWKDAIKQEVLTDPYYANVPKTLQRQEIDDRIKEFKENPQIEGRDEDRAEKMALDMEARAQRGEIPEYAAKDFRRQVFNSLFDMKEVRFRLNGLGYEAALNSLQEQFPYYIKDTNISPTRDKETPEFEMDLGYVEPGRNRPTMARAGLHGTKENPGEKFSASQADYQRGKTGKEAWKAGAPAAAASATVPGTETPPLTDRERTAQQARARRDIAGQERTRVEAADNAVMIRAAVMRGTSDVINEAGGQMPTYMTMEEPRFREWLNADPANEKEFHDHIERNKDKWKQTGVGGIPSFGRDYEKYSQARGKLFRTEFTRALGRTFPSTPYSFKDVPPLEGESKEVYHSRARQTDVTHAINNLSIKTPLFTTSKTLRDATDAEISKEVERVATLRAMRNLDPKPSIEDVLKENRDMSPDASASNRLGGALTSDKTMDDHLERLHRVRYLREMEAEARGAAQTGATTGFIQNPADGGTAGGGTSTPGGGSSPTPTPGAGAYVMPAKKTAAKKTAAKKTAAPPSSGAGKTGGVVVRVPANRQPARIEMMQKFKTSQAELNHRVKNEADPAERARALEQKNALEAVVNGVNRDDNLVNHDLIKGEVYQILYQDPVMATEVAGMLGYGPAPVATTRNT